MSTNKFILNLGKIIKNKSYVFILAGEIFVIAANFYVLKTVQIRFGQDDLNNVLLIFRYSAVLVPIILMGTGVSVPRHIGMQKFEKNNTINNIIYTGWMITSISTIVFFLILIFFDSYDKINIWLESIKDIQWILFAYSVALSYFGLAYGFLRGLEKIAIIEKLRISAIVLPSVAMILIVDNYQQYLLAISTLYLVISFYCISQYYNPSPSRFERQVFYFGAKRVIGDILYPLMMTMPVFLSVNALGADEGAELSFYFMIINATILLVNPISTLMLPRAREFQNHQEKLNLVIHYSPIVAFLLSCMFAVAAIFSLTLFSYEINFALLLVFSISTFFLSNFIIVRSLVDGIYEKPFLLYFTAISIVAEIIYFKFMRLSSIFDYSILYLIAIVIVSSLSFYKIKALQG